MLSFFALSLFIITSHFLCFFFVARVNFFVALTVSFARSAASYIYYPYLFPTSDQVLVYWPEVLDCNIESSRLNFFTLAQILHCQFGIESLQTVNLSYCLLASLFICISLRPLKYASHFHQNLFLNSSSNTWSFNFVVLIVCCDPSSLIFTSAFGKDLFTYILVLSYFSFLFSVRRLLSPVFIVFVLTLIITSSDRLYSTAILIVSTLLGQYVPNLSLLSRPPFFRLRLSFASRLSFKNLFASTLFLAVFVSLLLYILGSYLSSQSVSSIYDMYSADMGGSLVVPDSIPVLLKPFAFLFLPLPFLPFSFASLPLAISTLIMVSIISKIISLRLRSTGFSLLSVGIIMFLTISFAFGIIMSNFGLSVRYRTQYIMPMFAILLLLVPHLPSLPERR